jgi:phenylpyruvate tautomerase PptA (4-oxalocrotonate tautomerase family)
MPIIDIHMVVPGADSVPAGLAQTVADALGQLLGSPAGRTWVRASTLSATNYAENGSPLTPSDLPVFVTLLLAAPPEGEARAAQASLITTAVALAVGRDRSCVHVEYAAPGKGRMAFGGDLVQ